MSTQEKLKIEVEGFYRSASSEKVFIYMNDKKDDFFPFIAVVIGKFGHRSYTANGKYHFDGDSRYDLIAPWEE